MSRLWVFYDSRCGLCTSLAEWIRHQPEYIAVRLIPRGSAQVPPRFQPLARTAGGDLIAVNDQGEVWRNEGAWIMTLHCLRDYRAMARRLANPLLRAVRAAGVPDGLPQSPDDFRMARLCA